ncbi:ABCC5 [Bugula neritina]|uniref:ABCC5 n=1 Tax=Bugula neritina TaxID=10212 RepID=A0A7J7JG35_BUGNE|nr:ABCC5 [Bugula neritina]
MNATVRENIIFGNEFDSQWYNEVVDACALRSDFNQFTAGDQTEIGERGINLSGGQKQRISIARAVYSKPDIILLDDPLSAVDVLVGEHIFNRVLKGLLQHKSILFATHQLQFLPGCHYVLVMKEGKIIEEGTHEGLMTNSYGEYAHLIRSFHNAKEKEDADDNNEKADLEEGRDKKLKKKASFKKPRQLSIASDSTDDMESEMEEGEETPLTGKLTKEEELRQEQVSSAAYISYIKAAGGFLLALLVSLLMLVYTGFLSFTNYWLSVWTGAGGGMRVLNLLIEELSSLSGAVMNMSVNINGSAHFVIAESDRMVDNPHLKFYQLVYGLCMIGLVIATLSNAMTYVMFCLRASTSLHEQMFRKLVSCPMRFFDVTPSGQIINRFSKDTDEMDSSIPFISDQFFKIATSILSATVIISIAAPFFLLVVLVIGALFIFLSKFCEKGIQLTKKIDNVTKSPLFSHIATTVQGVGTIQAYKQEAQFLKRFNHLEDKNNMAVFLFDATTRWSSVRLDAVCLLITLATFFLVTLIPSNLLTPALAAMALTYSMNIGDLMQFTVRSAIEVGARFSSVERVHSYIENLEEDAPYTIEGNVPSLIWPDKGAIKFENVDVRYREGLPLVLKNITLDIKPQEKIGIVGRTGSGKSSLGLALFRMLELAGGSITIDGIDISTIGLEDLRSKLSIIPQDPVLFMGTVRYNLDPFNVYSDGDLWSALEKCNVKHTIKNLERKLEAPVVENGENFSVGERQLLCMARALLRHSKILLLDEATAAIDTETDSLIQETLKEAFADCTMLTIAHRLNTVVNDDRILVLDDGEVLEFDTPAALLANKNSSFAKMMLVQESQKQEAVNIVYST